MPEFPKHTRRQMLAGSAVSILAMPAATAANAAYKASDDTFPYEVTRSEAEWREMLGEAAYQIMREGGTEQQRSSPLWNETGAGEYNCKGCDLMIYDSRWKTVIEDKGWLFFTHGEPNALLLGIDWPEGADPSDPKYDVVASVETHCRRCGSHMGHYFIVDGRLLQCINGISLNFEPAEA